MKITTTKRVEEIKTYWLTDKVSYDEHYVDGELIEKKLSYHGDKIYGWNVKPIYGFDVNILKETNPYWDSYHMLEYDLPDDPEDIDVKKDIIFAQPSTHLFFDINKEPIPVVLNVDYIHFNNNTYDVDMLKNHLEMHNNVIECKEVDIPYYNSACGSKGLNVLVLPEKDWIQYCLNNKHIIISMFATYFVKQKDFLGIEKFIKNKEIW